MQKILRRARGLIIDNDTDRILLMQRVRDGNTYYTLCGGKLEDNETPEQGCLREIWEETSLHVTLIAQIFQAEDIFNNILNRHFIFLCQYQGGTAKLNGEEIERMTLQNQYHPTWVSLSDLSQVIIKPDIIATHLNHYLETQYLTQ